MSIVVSLSGCASISPHKLQPQQATMDDASIKIAEAASSVSTSLAEIARIESSRHPGMTKSLVSPDMPGMSELVSIDWSGPVGQLIEKLAYASSYKVRVLGKEPAIPVLVSVTATNVPLANVLRDIDFQAGKKAHIIVYPNADPKKRIIELRYAS